MQAKKTVLVGTLVALPVLIPVGRSMAEEGLRGTLTIGERLRSVSESGFPTPEDEGTSAVTTLNFGLTSENANQQLTLGLSTNIPYFFEDDDTLNSGNTLEDPAARLGYSIENRSSRLTFDTSYRRTDVGTSTFFDETIDQDVVSGAGTRTFVSARTGLTLGEDGPVTATLSHDYLRSTYSDTADPTLSDSTTHSLNGRLSFRVTPVASAFVFANWREQDQELATASDSTTQSIGIGGSYEISPVTSVSAQLSYDEDERVNSITSSSASGIGYLFGLRRATSNGAYTFDFSSTETTNGERQEASVGRSLDLKRGSIAFTLGMSRTGDSSFEPLANLDLNYDISETSNISASLSQVSDIDDDDQNTIQTRLNVSYNYEINALSSLSAGLRIANDNELGVGSVDARTISANLSYTREVGQDWGLVSGIQYETEQNDNRADRNTRTVFVGLEKTFNFRP